VTVGGRSRSLKGAFLGKGAGACRGISIAFNGSVTRRKSRSSFQPLFCPRIACPDHLRKAPGYRFRRLGFFTTARKVRIPRFVCLACNGSFSRQSFSVSYYCKRPEILAIVAAGLLSGVSHRRIARSAGCSSSTVTRMAARFTRHDIESFAKRGAEPPTWL
jgi:transposase-like protein